VRVSDSESYSDSDSDSDIESYSDSESDSDTESYSDSDSKSDSDTESYSDSDTESYSDSEWQWQWVTVTVRITVSDSDSDRSKWGPLNFSVSWIIIYNLETKFLFHLYFKKKVLILVNYMLRAAREASSSTLQCWNHLTKCCNTKPDQETQPVSRWPVGRSQDLPGTYGLVASSSPAHKR